MCSNNEHEYGAKSVCTCNLFCVYSQGGKETCFLQQKLIKVPEQQCSSRTGMASIHLSWSKYSGFFPPTFVHNSNKAHHGALLSPQHVLAHKFSAQQKICFLFCLCATGLNPFMAVQAERNQWCCSMWTPPVWKAMKRSNLCH